MRLGFTSVSELTSNNHDTTYNFT